MSDDLIKRLRSQEAVDGRPHEIDQLTDEAAALIEQQAARIAALEAQIAPVAPAVDAQPVAWFIADDNGEFYRATGYEHERDQWRAVGHEVFPLYASAQSEGLRKALTEIADQAGEKDD